MRLIQQTGINVKSAVDIFDNVDERIYADSCCHYNQHGNEILADYIAESMAPLLASYRD